MNEKQIIEGIPKIVDNAEKIYADADLLREYGRYERAYSLFQLSIEEIAKAFMLSGTLIFEDLSSQEVQTRLKNDLKDHEMKSKKSIGLESIFYQFLKDINIETYEELTIKSFKEYDSIRLLNEKKNAGFYTSFNGNKFQAPNELISKKDVNDIKTKAEFRIFLGKKIILAVSQRFDLIKDKIRELNFDIVESSRLNVEEFKRIRNKYGIK